MTIVSPVDGDLVDPDWAQLITDAVNDHETRFDTDLGKRGCTLRRAAAQTFNDAATTVVSWDTEDEDTDNLWSPGSPTIITAPETGLWAITFSLFRAAVVTGRSFMEIVPSAGVYSIFGGALRFPMIIGEQLAAASVTIPLTQGNTFTVQANLDGAGNSTCTAALTCYRVTGGS